MLDWFRRSDPPATSADDIALPSEFGSAVMAYSLKDPRLIEFMRGGDLSVTGGNISVESALRNPTMFRAVSLISNAIGMLPTHVLDEETGKKAKDHPLFRILHRRPNGYQTAYDFKSLMQLRALVKGNGYARIVRSRDVLARKDRVVALLPLDPDFTAPKLSSDGTVTYEFSPNGAEKRTFSAEEILHLRGLSLDGLNGISLVRQARDAIAIAAASEMAAGRLFRHGVLAGGALKHKQRLSPEAYGRLKESLEAKEGAENAGKTLILEEDMDFTRSDLTAKDSQLLELRRHQVEEIARVTGVPRPLLMVDETSWGSGIEALGQFFVQYALGPWFEAWQQAGERSLLADDEVGKYAIKFNPGALLRGSLKDQADFLSKALGAGGHQPWMWADEARDLMDLPKRDAPPNQIMGHNGGPTLDD